MNRITKEDLEIKIGDINYLLDTEAYFLSGAYGGYRLERNGKYGGTSDVFNVGFMPKRKLYEHLMAFIKGLIIGKRNGSRRYGRR